MSYNRTSFGFGGGLTPVLRNILFSNIIVFIITLNPSLYNSVSSWFALQSDAVLYHFQIWRLATYMFLHGDFLHILFNMFFLWMFGRELEYEWGGREFLKFYFICGIGAGLLNIVVSSSWTIGASGAIYGIMVAYALLYPNREILIYFLFPVKIKYFVSFLVFIAFFSTMGAQRDMIAHAAHLGGAVIGFIYLKYKTQIIHLPNIFKQKPKKTNLKYSSGAEGKVDYYRKKIDEILDKINSVGYLNLTDEEKELLEEGSKYLREHDDTEYH